MALTNLPLATLELPLAVSKLALATSELPLATLKLIDYQQNTLLAYLAELYL